MAVTNSPYNQARKKFANGEVNLSDLKVMLLSSGASFTAAHTSINSVAGAASPHRANEVYGNGWTEGGIALSSAAVTTVNTDGAKFDADDVTVSASGGDIGPATAAVIYEVTSGDVLFYVDFGGSETADDGTDFKIVWHANGIHLWSAP